MFRTIEKFQVNSDKDCIACYVTDEGFLFPSICSALSLRRACGTAAQDIAIFATGLDPQLLGSLGLLLAPFGVALRPLAMDLAAVDSSAWNGTHVPMTTLGRFFLPDLAAEGYARILYVDGDTVFRSAPTGLLQGDPGPGRIGAVEDIRSFARHDWIGRTGSFTRNYFDDIGVEPGQGYFNGGLFLARAADWPAMARDCLAFLMRNTAQCKFHDQSAMNAVLGRGNRVPLSLRWNFQTPYHLLGVFDAIDPVVLHFTEANKPWLGALRPWADWHALYLEIAALLPSLPRREPWDDAQVDAANRHYASRVRRQDGLFAFRLPGRRRQIRHYEAQCLI